MGLSVGHINEDVVGLITLVGLITIGLSTYLILYSHQIYDVISPALRVFQKKDPYRENKYKLEKPETFDIIIFGLGRFGSRIADMLDEHPEISYLGVDFDPEVVNTMRKQQRTMIYGELDDLEIVEQINIRKAKCVVSTINNSEASMKLIKTLRRFGFQGKIYLTAQTDADFEMLKPCKADDILFPQKMAADNFYNHYLKAIFKERRK